MNWEIRWEMQQSGDFSQLEELISGDSNVIGEFLAAPVSLKTNQVYKIENYGSSMAPFYSTLSIWIGGIVLVAMLKTGVSSKCTEGLKKVKPHQEYLGRYLLFLIVGLLQSTLIWGICYTWEFSVSIRSSSCWQDGSRALYM